MSPEFLVIAHRLPVKVENNQFIATDGGLASALRSAELEGKAHWVGCLGENPPEEMIEQLPEHCSHVSIKPDTFRHFYNGYSNSVLWPGFHDRTDLLQYEHEDWAAYFEANSLFAEKIMQSSSSRTPVWIHDYQLMMVPLLLKLHQPQRKVSFFLHIPWPELEIAKKIPRLSEIIRSLSKCDSICVHTAEYARNMQNFYEYVTEGKKPSLKILPICPLPIGISHESFSTAHIKIEDEKRLNWKGEVASWNGINIVGVDRLDYSKGIDQKLEVFSEFLELNPQWRGKVSLRQLLIPTREDVPAYRSYKQEVFELAEYINNKFGTPDWTPVDIFYGRTDAENLKRIYRAGDICWISSRKDGMNLVALEYLAAQDEKRPGVLLLSDQAGCAQHLQGSVIFRGGHALAQYKALGQALNMPDSEKRVRYRRDMNWIKDHSVVNWVEKNLEFLLPAANSPKEIRHEPLTSNHDSSFSTQLQN